MSNVATFKTANAGTSATFKRRVPIDAYPDLATAARLCAALSQYSPLIVGGAPRDILLDRDIRDFDIFVNTPDPFDAYRMVHQGTGIYLERQMTGEYPMTDYVLAHGRCQIMPSRFSAVGTPIPGIVSGVDSPLCEAWMTLAGDAFELHASEEFTAHALHKVLGFRDNCGTRNDRREKLIEKFPDFLVVDLIRRNQPEDLPF